MEVILLTIPRGTSMLIVSRLPVLYCLDVPYSLVVTGQERVDISALF